MAKELTMTSEKYDAKFFLLMRSHKTNNHLFENRKKSLRE